ncbi:MAG: sulfurtransferase complex subunit TusC [Nitrospirae bacterium]|nr:sulfurtransferase complex subunit TusC [Nitrospirota bacterium]
MAEKEKCKIMFVMRKAPHGSIYAYEGLEAILIMGAYEQEISVAFIDDGVFALKKEQDTKPLGVKEFSKTFTALEDYDITNIYVDRESLELRGLSTEDLLIPVKVMEAGEIAKIMEEQHVLLPF